MNRANIVSLVAITAFIVIAFNNCGDMGTLDIKTTSTNNSNSVTQPPPPAIVVPPSPPPPPPPNTPAFVTRVDITAFGATAILSGPVQGLRYFHDKSNGNILLQGPFGTTYDLTITWPVGTTFVCFQAQGTDGLWNGPVVGDPQQCHSVP